MVVLERALAHFAAIVAVAAETDLLAHSQTLRSLHQGFLFSGQTIESLEQESGSVLEVDLAGVFGRLVCASETMRGHSMARIVPLSLLRRCV